MKLYLNKLILLFSLAGVAMTVAFAQAKAKTVCPDEKPQFASLVKPEEIAELNPPTEKAVAADARATVSFCVSGASVNVRGWQRNEVRAMVEEGGKLGFRIQKRNGDNAATWLTIVGFDPKEPAKPGTRRQECLTGGNIEIEVPFGAFVEVRSRDDANIKIESIAKTRVQNINGNILISDVREEADASSLAGNVVAEDSVGKITLKTSTGNVYGIRLKPLNDYDSLIAKSDSGNVTLQDVAHAKIEGGSSNSNFNYFGNTVAGGVYRFTTLNGAITLFLPLKSSFQLNATSNSPVKVTGLPFKPNIQQHQGVTRTTGVYGDGDANINLISANGPLRINKQN